MASTLCSLILYWFLCALCPIRLLRWYDLWQLHAARWLGIIVLANLHMNCFSAHKCFPGPHGPKVQSRTEVRHVCTRSSYWFQGRFWNEATMVSHFSLADRLWQMCQQVPIISTNANSCSEDEGLWSAESTLLILWSAFTDKIVFPSQPRKVGWRSRRCVSCETVCIACQ